MQRVRQGGTWEIEVKHRGLDELAGLSRAHDLQLLLCRHGEASEAGRDPFVSWSMASVGVSICVRKGISGGLRVLLPGLRRGQAIRILEAGPTSIRLRRLGSLTAPPLGPEPAPEDGAAGGAEVHRGARGPPGDRALSSFPARKSGLSPWKL